MNGDQVGQEAEARLVHTPEYSESGESGAVPFLRKRQTGGYLLFTLVLAGLSALLVREVVPEVLNGELVEPDNYMRLVRVTHLVETRDWYDNTIPRSNAPHGEVLHWTRPLDVIILGVSAPLLLFFPYSKALHLAGVILPPLLLLLTCFAVAWAIIPFAGRRFQFYAMITILAQVGVVGFGLPGRIDHHALLMLLFALEFGLAARWILTPYSRWLAVSAGAVLGLGLWVSPEFLVPTALVLITGAMAWIVDAGDNARKNLWLSVGFLGTSVVAWLLEHPPARLLAEEYDRVSAPHILLGALALAYWVMMVRIEAMNAVRTGGERDAWRRSSLAILGSTAAAGVMFAVYPAFFQGPTSDIDPRIWLIWRNLIEEGRTWLPPATLVDAGNLIAHLGAAAFCIPFVAWVLAREQRSPQRWPWRLLALALAVYLGLALFMVRHVPYAELVLAIVTVTFLSRILPKIDLVRNQHLRTAGRAGAAAIVITGPLFLGLALTAYGGQTGQRVREASRQATDLCPISSLISFISSEDGIGERPMTIAAHVDYGTEILYRTPHRVLGTLYHRNADGILAVFAVLGGTDLERILGLVQARSVDLILVCPRHSWLYGSMSEGDDAVPTLHDLLLLDRGPDWLERVPIPEEVAGAFRLFRVSRDHQRPQAHSAAPPDSYICQDWSSQHPRKEEPRSGHIRTFPYPISG